MGRGEPRPWYPAGPAIKEGLRRRERRIGNANRRRVALATATAVMELGLR
jgi:hypothetical protein